MQLRRLLTSVAEVASFWVDGYAMPFLCSHSVCLGRNSRHVLVGGETLTLWHAAHGRRLRNYEGHTGIVTSVCMSPDERYAVSGGTDTSLRLWKLAPGECLRTFEGHSGTVTSAWLDRSGRFVLSGAEGRPKTPAEITQTIMDSALGGHSDRGEIRLWEASTGRCLRVHHSPRAHTPWTSSLCLNPAGTHAVWGTGTYKLQVWAVPTGRCIRTFGGFHGGAPADNPAKSGNCQLSPFERSGSLVRWVLSACWSEDGRYLLTGGRPYPVVWDATTGRWLHMLAHVDGNTVCFSGDGQYALTGGPDKTVRLWEIGTQRCLHTFSGHTAPVSAACMSWDGRHVLSASTDGLFKFWVLDWYQECADPTDWDEGARPYLRVFLALRTPYAGELPDHVEPTSEQITGFLTRTGEPKWSEEEFRELLQTLRNAGYGHIRPGGVRRELETMAADWREPRRI
jgi:WD40 repeat protein